MSEEVKIYGNNHKDENSEFAVVLEMMKEHRANGNIDKAKALGAGLSNMDIRIEDLVSPKFLKSDIIYQIKVLFIFAAEANLQMLISSPLLATTAINAMYDEIQNRSSGFYENISDGMAFSFYYASVKDGGNIARNVGETFAMLCSVEDNESFIETGSMLYETATKIVSRFIDEAGFLQI